MRVVQERGAPKKDGDFILLNYFLKIRFRGESRGEGTDLATGVGVG